MGHAVPFQSVELIGPYQIGVINEVLDALDNTPETVAKFFKKDVPSFFEKVTDSSDGTRGQTIDLGIQLLQARARIMCMMRNAELQVMIQRQNSLAA